MYSKKFEKLINQFFKDHKIFKTPFKNKELFNKKTILITGGAGSIGSDASGDWKRSTKIFR